VLNRVAAFPLGELGVFTSSGTVSEVNLMEYPVIGTIKIEGQQTQKKNSKPFLAHIVVHSDLLACFLKTGLVNVSDHLLGQRKGFCL